MISDKELKEAFDTSKAVNVRGTERGSYEKMFSVIYDNGMVKYQRNKDIGIAQKFAVEYGKRFLNGAKPLFTSVQHPAKDTP